MSRQAELKPTLSVAAGILKDADGKILIAERLGDGPFHGMWEFPGGKIDRGETPAAALKRELEEELGVVIRGAESFMTLFHEYPDRAVSIEFFLVQSWSPAPTGREGQRLKWVDAAVLSDENLLPADAPVVSAIQQL